MQFKLSINLRMKEHPHAAAELFFTEIEDLLMEVRESLTKTPSLPMTITTNVEEGT